MRLYILLWAAVSTASVGKGVRGFYVRSSDKSIYDYNKFQDTVHAEELLEKYGYLSCVPEGSEENTHLHRILLRRLHSADSQTNQPLDLRLPQYDPFPGIHSRSTGDFVNTRKWKEAHMAYLWKKRREHGLWPSGNEWAFSSSEDFLRDVMYIEVEEPEGDGKIAYLPVCSHEEVQHAIQNFQETYQVGTKEGNLDSSTLSLLSKPRCGNPDVLIPENRDPAFGNEIKHPLRVHGALQTGFLHRKRRSLIVPERGKEKTDGPKRQNENISNKNINSDTKTDFNQEKTNMTTIFRKSTENKQDKDHLRKPDTRKTHLESDVITHQEKSDVSKSFKKWEEHTQDGNQLRKHDAHTHVQTGEFLTQNEARIPRRLRKYDGYIPDQDHLRNKVSKFREEIRMRHPQTEQHIEWEPHPAEAATRRRRWIEDLSSKIQKGEEANLATVAPHLRAKHRKKRSTFTQLGERFIENLITWRLVNTGYSSQLEVGVQRASLALAFRMWSEVIPTIFLEDTISDTTHVDINIGFGRRHHLGCINEFDGYGGELSHALREANEAKIHMDDDEHFTLDSEHGTNLLKVAVHEIGHILGLDHVLRNYSIMYAIYEKLLPNQGLELGWEDRKLVQMIYGSCIGAFDTVLDLLKWRPDGTLSYNTFFFRGTHFWMYENRYNRTRFGDPLYVSNGWPGIPNNIDGYAHIWTPTRDAHLFFKAADANQLRLSCLTSDLFHPTLRIAKAGCLGAIVATLYTQRARRSDQGDSYYVYDATTGSVAPGYPRRIAQDFHGPPTAKNPNPRPIPSNIDTVYFDKRDQNLYFFKGKKVYGYDVSQGSSGCCLPGYPKNIRKEFVPADDKSRPLPAKDLDAVYYSYTDQTIFFIKDRLFWELVSFHPNDMTRQNEVMGPFYVHEKWYDICDTTLDPYNAYIIE